MNSRVPKGQRGITLVEVLVVLVIVSLLSTLLIQGVGFFLNKYRTVQRYQGIAAAAALQQQWFVQTVNGLIPYRQTQRRASGEAKSFSGISSMPLSAEPGVPVRMAWSIVEDGEDAYLEYGEGDSVRWRIRSLPRGASFSFADAQGAWHPNWPPQQPYRDKLPRMVRIAAEDGVPLLLASVPQLPRPVADFRE